VIGDWSPLSQGRQIVEALTIIKNVQYDTLLSQATWLNRGMRLTPPASGSYN